MSKQEKIREIILDELKEQGHIEEVEFVILWALQCYVESPPRATSGRLVAYAIKERIEKAIKQ